jgi:hypothetical protein
VINHCGNDDHRHDVRGRRRNGDGAPGIQPYSLIWLMQISSAQKTLKCTFS